MTRPDKGGKRGLKVRITKVTILLDSSDSRSGVLQLYIKRGRVRSELLFSQTL